MNKTGNYCAFYVIEPFIETNLGANLAHDFCYYNTLRMWKGQDPTFPFIDSHEKTYNVRDSSSWETLQGRLRERLRASKNIIFFLSSITVESKALKEELDYGMGYLGLPVIVIYPDYKNKNDIANAVDIRQQIKILWNKVPVFLKHKSEVSTIHIPMDKTVIRSALNEREFMISSTSSSAQAYFYS